MADPTEHNLTTRRPYLIAAWPGMGNVAAIAGGYLVRKLNLEPVRMTPMHDTFDLNFVNLKGGIVERPHLPRGLMFRTPEDRPGRPVVVYLAEAQPSREGYNALHTLLDQFADDPIERVFTFASLASGVHPLEEPKVTAAATTRTVLSEIEWCGVHAAKDGRIGGMNGLLLGVAAERELHGACLLAEIPFFAAKAPNFRAARAVLNVLNQISELDVDLTEISAKVDETEDDMMRLKEKFESGPPPGQVGQPGQPRSEYETDEEDADVEIEADEHPGQAESGIDPATREAIEALFEQATENRALAEELKGELDRLGVFEQYEDRFLDLFQSRDDE